MNCIHCHGQMKRSHAPFHVGGIADLGGHAVESAVYSLTLWERARERGQRHQVWCSVIERENAEGE